MKIFTSAEKAESYFRSEWKYASDPSDMAHDLALFKAMVKTGRTFLIDWDVIKAGGKTYYIHN